ncbi:hypothetical protein [Bradyrhizobium sp. MOS003]|uniref:hypothetical protein n=1 Tax=Bradyrhizobium sp. MOS003 TaxID=2133946 RepID=UPI000D13A3CE|nr:hypothetical protein [Bradyrhizobium sp. MOS003]PSO16992.1 hypothetical protein C7G42_19550 [Bradyrhizobium sp. MOS003]
MDSMSNWQKSTTRQAPKTKAELRLMLTEAVRNTQPGLEPQRLSKSRRIAAGTAPADLASGDAAPVR